MSAPAYRPAFSRLTEVVAGWSKIQQLLRSGSEGRVVPVVIPKESRGFGWLYMTAFAVYVLGMALTVQIGAFRALFGLFGLMVMVLALLWWWRSSIIEIEQGTTGIFSKYGQIVGTLPPGRHYLWWPWDKVSFIVDTSTEIPYTAPILACPTEENVPLKSIEFFLKFRIEEPLAFVRNIGASNFDIVLSSAVQDAIRRRSRMVHTEKAFDLRGSDVGDMQTQLNRQMARYGVRIIGANIPDVQLPDQYQQHLATKERVAKELDAYEREWELIRKQRIDTLLMEIERAKKDRDAKLVEVKEAQNKAREDVARMLQEKQTEADRVAWDIEAQGQAALKSAENEAKALHHLGKSYQDNWAVLQYELAQRKLQVAEKLARHAPRPLVLKGAGADSSPLSTLLLAQLLPQVMQQHRAPQESNPVLQMLLEDNKSS